MKIIVGLGNPGEEYINSRHNSGWLVLDKLAAGLKFQNNKKFLAEICELDHNNEKILLVKPQTYMNESGKAVKQMIKWLNGKMANFNNNLWLIHDEIDLELGIIRIIKNRSSAGHKGVDSIIKELATQDFTRFRIGVGKPNINQKDFVLAKPAGQEKEIFEKSINLGAEMVCYALEKGIEKAMNKYNSKKENA